MTTEHGQIGMADVTERDSVAKKLIDEENDELKLIQSNCTRDLQTIGKPSPADTIQPCHCVVVFAFCVFTVVTMMTLVGQG